MTLTPYPTDRSTLLARHTVADGRPIDQMVHQDGFVLVPELCPRAAAEEARRALIVARASLAQDGRSTWHNPPDTALVAWASRLVPELRNSPIRSAARALASEIVGGRVVERFDYALVTPAGEPGAPWHRDADSFKLPGAQHRVHVWVALQDVDEANGCLSYVPRRCPQEPPEENAIACPIQAGSAMIHDEQSLHRSEANRTDQPRWAWVLQFAATTPARRALFGVDRARATLRLTAPRRRLAAATDNAGAR